MISIGIDCGSQNTKGVALENGIVLARAKLPTEFDAEYAARQIKTALCTQAGISEKAIQKTIVTGTGRSLINWADETVNEINAAAAAGHFLAPSIEMVIDIGGESCHVIRLDERGSVRCYEVNDKCASGAGTFIEAMARALQIPVENMGICSLNHQKHLVTNAQCVVFAESEVISLIHARETVEDIAYGIHMGIANRIAALVRRIGVPKKLLLIGGPGNNQGLVQCMNECYACEVAVPEYPEYATALGAALYGSRRQEEE